MGKKVNWIVAYIISGLSIDKADKYEGIRHMGKKVNWMVAYILSDICEILNSKWSSCI